MDYIFDNQDKVKGTEILFFQDAEIEKIKGNSTSFASMGTLSVLFFSDYNRYVLQLNDWRYPLLRRLPIIATDKNELTHRTYILPALNGFTFILKLNNIPNVQVLANFETILTNNSNFSYRGLEMPFRKIEASPDDKLSRHKPQETTSIFDIISESVKAGVEKIKITAETLTKGTKNINSKKKKVLLKDIKNKNYKKNARSTFKKDFFEKNEKKTQDFLKRRRENINLLQARNIEDMTKIHAPEFFIAKEDIEEAILNNKDLAISGKFVMLEKTEKTKTVADYMKQGLMSTLGENLARTTAAQNVETQKLEPFENITHQG